MVEFGFWEVVGTVVALVIAAAMSLFVKEWVQRRLEYGRLKKKVEKIAGKGAKVVAYGDLYTIESIDFNGMTLKGRIQTVFIPIGKVLETEIVLPVENYKEARAKMLKENLKEMGETFIPYLRDEMMPAMIDGVKEYIVKQLEPGEELDAIVGLKVRKALEEEGIGIKRLEGRSEEDR